MGQRGGGGGDLGFRGLLARREGGEHVVLHAAVSPTRRLDERDSNQR